MFHLTIPLSAGIGALFQFSFDFSIYRQVFLIADGMLKAMKKTIWKSILCAMLVTLTACICVSAHSLPSIAASRAAAPEKRLRAPPIAGYINPRRAIPASPAAAPDRPAAALAQSINTPASRTAAREKRIRTRPTVGYIARPNLPPRAALLTAPNLRTAVLTQAVKNPTRRMIPMTMVTMPSMMMTTTMRIATTATRTTQQA